MAVGNAINLRGAPDTDKITVPDDSTIEPTSITLVVWFWHDPTQTVGNPNIIVKGVYPTDSYYLNTDASNVLFSGITTDVTRQKISAGVISTSTWHLAVVTFDNSTKVHNFYIDNVLVGTGTYTGEVIAYSGVQLTFGRNTFNNVHWRGRLDEIAIWGKVLSINDISDLWASGAGLHINPDINFPTDGGPMDDELRAVWWFDETALGQAPGGLDAEDSSANSNHGTADGGMVDGNFITGHIDIPDTDVTITPSPVTLVCATVNPTIISGQFFLCIGNSICSGYPGYNGPENIGGESGDPDSQIWPYLIIELGGGIDFYNAGINGDSSTGVKNRIEALLISKEPTDVYLHVGINDLNLSSAPNKLSIFLDNLNEILDFCTTYNAALTVGELIPLSFPSAVPQASEAQQSLLKQWNAAIRVWCTNNNARLAPTYEGMSDHITDDIAAAFDSGDGLHPSIAGYENLGLLYAEPITPPRFWRWGNTTYDQFADESWAYWGLGSGASISGDADTGTLVLQNTATADSPVKCLEAGDKKITITATVSAGDIIIQYRTYESNFDRNNLGIGWSVYSEQLEIYAAQFFQIRLIGDSVADANVDEIILSWGIGRFRLVHPGMSGGFNA